MGGLIVTLHLIVRSLRIEVPNDVGESKQAMDSDHWLPKDQTELLGADLAQVETDERFRALAGLEVGVKLPGHCSAWLSA
jgi:hypothetical protein